MLFAALSPRPAVRLPRSPFVLWTLGWLVFAAFVLATTAARAGTIYVRADASPGGNGQSWATAYNNIHIALAQVDGTTPTEIWLKTGVYRPYAAGTPTTNDRNVTFNLKSNLTVRGGFAGTESAASQRVASATATSFTVISGDMGVIQTDTITDTTPVNALETLTFDSQATGARDNSFNLFHAVNVSGVTLDRLVVAGACTNNSVPGGQTETMLYPSADEYASYGAFPSRASNGGGLYVNNAFVTVSDCWFVGNFSQGLGGAVAVRGGSLAVHDSRFARNVAGHAGGALCIQDASIPELRDNTFYGNSSGYLGGAVFIDAPAGSAYLKSYITGALNSLAVYTQGDSDLIPGNTENDSRVPYSYLKTVKAGGAVAQSLLTAYASPKLIQKFGSEAFKALMKSAKPFTLGYGGVTMIVNVVDLAFSIAQLAGVDPNNIHVKNWNLFSTNFAAYATPMGLAQTVYSLVYNYLYPPPSFAERATALRNRDYTDNHNKAGGYLLFRNRFEANYSAGMGGALVVIRANVLVTRTRFIENESAFGGAAVTFLGYNTADIENSAFVRNSSRAGDSAITTAFRSANRFLNTTLVGNHSNTVGGHAIGVDTGADLILGNSILWDNTNGDLNSSSNPNRLGGADISVTRKADFDANGLKTYNEAGDSHGLFTGVALILRSNIQSLDRLVLGTDIFHNKYTPEIFASNRDSGFLLTAGHPNVGEGIAPVAQRANISRDPVLLLDIYPHPSSPVINTGSAGFRFRDLSGYYDIDSNSRTGSQGRIPPHDMGAVEADGKLPAGIILYVNGAVSASGDGFSWDSAFKTIPEALAQPLSPGGQIWVAAGTYPATGAMILPPGCGLVGGFSSGATSLDESDPVARPTIISGANGAHILLSGLAKIADIPAYRRILGLPRIVRGITFQSASSAATVAAVRLSIPVVVQSCVFKNNTGARALSIEDPNNFYIHAVGQIIDSTFEANLAGAITCSDTNLEIIRSRFYDNVAPEGAAIYKGSTHSTQWLLLERNVFYNNTATAGRGGAVFLRGNDLVAAHNVFADNFAQPTIGDTVLRGGAGLWWSDEYGNVTRYELLNNIFYGNRLLGSLATVTSLEFQQIGLSDSVFFGSRFASVITGNCIEGLNTLAPRGGSAGNVDYDPFFVAPASRDFSLASDSLLANRGADYSSGTDAATTINGVRDIGAAESAGTTVRPAAIVTLTVNKPTDTARTFTLQLTNPLSGAGNYTWEVLRPGAIGVTTIVNDAHHSGAATGVLTVANLPHTWSGSRYRLRYNTPVRVFSNDVVLDTPPSILYVSAGATGDGTSWSSPLGNIWSAISLAQPYTQIWIRSGTHFMDNGHPQRLNNRLSAPAGVRFYGGFAGTETTRAQRLSSTSPTLLHFGDDDQLTVRNTAAWPADNSAIPTVFDQVTVTGPTTRFNKFCLELIGADTVLTNVKFTDLAAAAVIVRSGQATFTGVESLRCAGTPITADGATISVVSSSFTESGALTYQTYSGALTVTNSTATITDSRFTANPKSPVVSSGNGSITIERSRFLDNRATALQLHQSGASRVANSLFARNRASADGGAITNTSSGAVNLVHLTLVENSARTGGAIYNTGASLTLANSIVWDNSATTSAPAIFGTHTRVSSHVQGQVDYAPFFNPDAAIDDYRLADRSPLVNRGSTSVAPGATDLLGNVRFRGTTPDLGAIETAVILSTSVYFTSPPVHRVVYEDRPVSFVTAGGIGSTTTLTLFDWQYVDSSGVAHPIANLPGWSIVRDGFTTTLSHPSVPLSLNGLRLRLVIPGLAAIADLRLDVLPRKVFRVDADVATSGNSSDWASASATIGAALAPADGDTDLWIAGGDYPETELTANEGTRLYVGFAGNETSITARDPAANPVRLIGAASRVTLVPTAAHTLPDFAFHIVASPSALTRYVERPIAFTARTDGTATLAWQYRSGSAWLPISNLPGWTVTQVGETSTLAYPAAELAQNGLQLRAAVPGTNEASFEALLTVNPRSILYVNSYVPASGDGRSWATALKTLGEAFARADDGTDIWIATGTYYERTLPYIPGANIYSGFDGNETDLNLRNPLLRPVTLIGSGSTIAFGATSNSFRYAIATPTRSRALYIDQPGSLSTSLTGSGATIQWQYLDGTTWLPLTSLPGWTVTTTGLLSKAVHLSFPASYDGLKVRVAVPANNEASAPVTLSVANRVTRYVNAAATGSGTGADWANAFTTLAPALAIADDGTDIWIASGTYDEPTRSVISGAHLYGGFAGTETTLAERTGTAPATILRNSTGNRVLTIDLSSAEFDLLTLVEGVTFDQGTATAPLAYLKGRSIAFETVTFANSARAVFLEGDTTLAEFSDCVFLSNTQAIVSAAGPAVSIDSSFFGQNAQALTFAAGASLVVTDSDFEQSSDYAISAAPGFSVGACVFTNNARDIVVTGEGAALTRIDASTFTGTTVRALASATPVELSASDFTSVALGLELTGAAANSQITECSFTNGTGDAVRAPAGIQVTDTTFTANARGLVLSAAGTAVSRVNGGTFANHTTAGLASAAAVRVADTAFTANATGLLLTAAAEFSSVTNGTFTANTAGISTVSGLTVIGSTFTGNATGLAVTSGGTLGTTVNATTFTGETVAGIVSAGRLSTDTVTFDDCPLGVSLTGGTGISRLVAATFKDGVAGLNVAAPARAELVDPVFTGNSGISFAATGASVVVGNVSQINVLVTHGTFTGNTGPVFLSSSGYHKFDRCTFVDNVTANPILSATGGYLAIHNSLIARNTATNNSVVRASGSGRLTIATSTIADNESGTTVGAVGGNYSVTQSILWGNRASAASARIESMQADVGREITKSIIEGLQSSYLWIQPVAQNTAHDPLFTDARAGDYTLQPYSPAIDLGGATFAGNLFDLPGSARVQSTGVDLGAYESASARAAVPLKLTFPSAARTIVTGDAATYAVTFATGNGRDIRWQINTGSGWTDLAADAYHQFNYANGVSRLVVAGDFALSGYRYRAIISDNGTDLYVSPDSLFTVVARPIFYVDASATGAATGLDWANAFPTLDAALAAAPAFSDIRVAAGTYRAPAGSSFPLRRRQRLLGGYLAGTDTRDSIAHASTLSSAAGAPADSIILLSNSDQGLVDDLTTVDGFTFTSGGYGIVLNQASPVVRDCRFQGLGTALNVFSSQLLLEDSILTGQTRPAIIVYGSDSDITVSGCVFTANAGAIAMGDATADDARGGDQRAVISDSVFTDNTVTGSGGAISSRNPGSTLVISHCEFIGNTATSSGGAISAGTRNSITVRQSLFADNQAAVGSALATTGTASLVFTTVAGNHATQTGEVSLSVTGGLVLRDSILWGNTTSGSATSRDDQIRFRLTGNPAVFSDSIIEGLSGTTGDRLLPFDPKFIDAANADYRLAPDSPALGLGRAADLLSGETDLDGAARPAGSSADLGAYESSATPAPAYAFNLPTTLTPPVGTGFTLTQATPAGFTSAWEYFDGSVWRAINLIGQTATGPAGAYSYTTFDPATGQTTLVFSAIDSALNGVLLRFRLTYSGTDYTSPAIAVTVPGFETIYVDASVSASGDGATWSTAFKTIPEALAAVNNTRRVVHVAAGTYRGPFTLPMRFEMLGGFPSGGSTLASRDPSAHAAILTGLPAVLGDARAASVVRFNYSGSGFTQPVLDGFTIEDGQTGLLVDANVTPTLRKLLVRGHTATGLVIQSANALVQDSIFENNSGFDGGAVRASASVTLERVILRGNTATSGGGLWALSATLRNVLATGNVAVTGGGLWINSGAVLEQTTLAGNRADTNPALHTRFGVATLRNSIVWGNRTSAGVASTQLAPSTSNPPSSFSLAHTIVEQASASSSALRFDPLFTSPLDAASAPSTGGDYTVRTVSPAIGAGDNALATALATDLAGQPRILGTVDLGAYESAVASPSPLSITATSAALIYDRENAANNVFTVTATNAASILWQYAGPHGVWTSLDGVAGFSGATSATLTITAANMDLNGYRFRALVTGADATVITSEERLFTIYAPHLHVNASRPGSELGDGLSWSTAYKSLDAALAAIPTVPDLAEIWIAAGTYAPTSPATTFTVRAGVSLYGGFSGTETLRAQRDPAVNVTALAAPAGGSASIVTVPASPALSVPARFDGLTIRDNSTGRGIDNSVGQRPLVIERVRFTGIFARALTSSNASVTLRHSEFRGNGGASASEDVLRVNGGSALVEDTLIAGNHSSTQSTTSFLAPVVFRQVTIANNIGSSCAYFGHSNTQVYNSILRGNRTAAGQISLISYSNTLYVANNNVVDLVNVFVTLFSNKRNNLDTDAGFSAPVAATAANLPTTTGDYSLGSGSSIIDLGDNTEVSSSGSDLAGATRQQGRFVDLGAYEYSGESVYAITAQPADRAVTSGNATFTITSSRAATYTWETSADAGASFTAIPGAVYSNVAAGVINSYAVATSAANHGHLFRARVQFTTGPLLLSAPASLSTLTVAAALTRPAGQGTPATYATTASFAPAAWQWQLSSDAGTTFEDISGATANTLSVAADATSAGNTYRARATFAAGAVLHTNAVAYASADVSTAPASAASGVASSVAFAVTGGAQPASLTDGSLHVHADLIGRLPLADLGAPAFSGVNVSLSFNTAPHAGERIQVTTTSALLRADGLGLRPRVWEFRMPVASGPGIFEAPVPVAASAASAFALGDLNGLGWVDALVASSSGLQLYSNTAGVFTASGAPFGPAGVSALALGALTPSGALDVAALTATGDIQLWTNDGSGAFTLAQTLADLDAQALAFGDLDADGDLDLLVATAAGNAVWINDGTGAFLSATVFDTAATRALALGDLDQDGDLDALVTGDTSTTVWLNNGSGAFTAASTLAVGFDRVALADLDTDGRLDAVLVSASTPATLWRNLGSATFETLDALPGGGASATLATGDTNGDGLLDLVLTDTAGRTGAWHTSADLATTHDAVQPAFSLGASAQLADLNDDGALDLFGLTPAGTPVVARYALIGNTGLEDTTFGLLASGFRPTPPFQGISITTRPAHGTLFINGQPLTTNPNQFGSHGSFNITSLANVTYRPNANFQGVDSFKWRNALGETPRTYWIRIADVADPVLAAPDSIAVLESATATTLVGGSANVLANDTNNDAGTFEATILTPPVHGALTLNSDGTFAYVHDGSPDATDSFVYRATNLDTGDSATATVTIAITRLNDAPATLSLAATDGVHYTGRPAGETVATLSATDPDPEDADLLVFSLVGGSGSDHNADFVIDGSELRTAATINAASGLTRSVRIRVTDTLGLLREQSFTVAFTRAPTAANTTVSTSEDIPLALTLPGSGGATTLAYQLVSLPTHGVLTRPDAEDDDTDVNTFTYTPDADFHGTDTLVYRVLDSALVSADATVTINIADVNDTPTLAAVAPITIDEDASTSFTLVGADVETASVTYQLTSTPALGTVQFSGAAVTYTPAANAHGVETLTFTASDGVNTSAAIQVVVTITSLDDAPVIAAIAPRTVQRNRVDTFTAAPSDVESPVTLRVGTAPQHGSVSLSAFAVTYTPDTGYTGADSYTLIANDGALDSAPATVAVTVTPIATENVALTVYRGLYEYTAVPAYAGTGTWTGATVGNIGTPAHGTATLEGAQLVYDHNGNTATSDSFTYTVTNAADDIRTIAVSVTIKDRVLDVTDGSFFSTTGNLRAAIDLTNRFAADTVAPAHTAGATWLIRILPQAGPTSTLLHFTQDAQTGSSLFRIQGNVTIDAAASPGHIITGYFPGTERHFLVQAAASLTLKHVVLLDGGNAFGGSVLNFGTFTAEDVVFRLNSADLGAALYNNGGTASLTDCVFDQNAIDANDSAGGIVASRNGSVSLTRVDFTANTGKTGGDLYVVGDAALATVSVTDSTVGVFQFVTQNGGTLAVTGLPKAIDDAVTYTIGQTLTLDLATLLANDVGTPAASVSVAATSTKGVTITRTGDNLAYLAPAGVTTDDSFTYTITDAAGRTSTATVRLSFVNAAALPRGNADTGSIYRGLAGTIDVLANDTDDTGDTLTLAAVTQPAHGTTAIENGVVSYTHNGNAPATDTFTYSVTNSSGTTANVVVNVTIAERILDATSGADSGPGTLRAALAFVDSFAGTTLAPAHTTAPDWTIRIVGATGQRWVTTSNTQDDFIPTRSAFRIAGKLTIDGSLSPDFELQSESPFPSTVRNFYVMPGASLTLKNLKLVGNGFAFSFVNPDGGSVLNQGTFVADHVTFASHSAARGAAVYNDGGTATLVDCTFTNNELMTMNGVFGGGAVASYGGSLTLVDNTFSDTSINPEVNVFGSATVFFGSAPNFTYLLGGSVTTPDMPVATNDTVERPSGKTFKVSAASLLANDLNATGATVTFSATTQAGYTLTRSGAFLLYQAPASFGGGDSFTYTLTRTVAKLIAGTTRNFTITSTATVDINVTPLPESATIAPTLTISDNGNGGLIIRVLGIPGRPYTIERSYTLQEDSWHLVDSFNAPANGLHQYEDGPIPDWNPDSGEPPITARFYRVRYNQ